MSNSDQPSHSDQQLLECIIARDALAFAEFYDRHAPRVFGLLIRLLGTRDDAEDVLQETFWQVWRSADRYDALRASPEVWLATIARSRAVDRLRRRPRGPETISDVSPVASDNPCEALALRETQEELRAALARLPEEQRTAIALAFFDGFTHLEIAQRQGIPLGTAKTRIALGMKRLRGLLRPIPSERVK